MYFELKENRPHGTPENPFSQYHISDVKRAFQIPVHWHDELEIIYVKQGKLHVTISGENYIGSPKDAFVVSPGSLHLMGSPTGDADYYTFLFPLEYISFQTDDLMEKSILSPNYTREISLNEFGAQFHLSEKYISRYFKEHFHITLSQYVNHLRLEHARQLLEESAASVTEVAMCSGYQNVSYFIRSFKKMYGVSPLKYRNFQTLP